MSIRVQYLATTILLIAIGVGHVLVQEWLGRSAPRLAGRAEASTRPRSLPTPPTAREILDRAADLPLAAEQLGRLESLDRRWREEATGLERELKVAEEEFSRFLTETQANGRVSLQDIQRRFEDLGRLGVALRRERERHSDAAMQILTETQRGTLLASRPAKASGGER